MPEPESLLDPETINSAQALGLHARYIVEGYMSGEHKSPFRGFSLEFSQHREYVPGDDTRHLDWKLFGRTDSYFLKQYEQQTNYIAHILLDGSASMRYGSGTIADGNKAVDNKRLAPSRLTKLQYAKAMAACLSYLILHQRDAVSLGIFDNQLRSFIPHTGNLASIHHLISTLVNFDSTGTTSVGEVLHNMAGAVKRRGIVILISDLFDDEQKILNGIQHLRFSGSEVIVFHVLDPYELEFPFQGMVEFDGLEESGKLMSRPSEIRKSYLRELEKFRRKMIDGCEKNATHYTLIDTSHSLHEVLSGYLAFRIKTR